MSDIMLDLLASIKDENWGYDTNVFPTAEVDYDYIINCKKFFDHGDNTDFDFKDFLELMNEFEDFDVHSYVRDEPPFGVDRDGIYQHVVEIAVKE